MQTRTLGHSALRCSPLAYGCWRIAGTWNPAEVTPEGIAAGKRAVIAAYEAGYTLFDHADIYCRGEAERIFGQVLKDIPTLRQNIQIASKCGIRPQGTPGPGTPTRYDFSKEYIVASCEASLQRLGVETLDLYQLHRPDYLMQPDEVAAAFESLHRSGKVREFGVSNFRTSQVDLLRAICPRPLQVNQIEISLAHLLPLEDGTLDQCLKERITPMAWSPLGGGHLAEGATRVLPSQESYHSAKLLSALDAMARHKETHRSTLALAWLLKHPAGILPIVGSIQPGRIRTAVQATEISLSREDWYTLLTAARSDPLP